MHLVLILFAREKKGGGLCLVINFLSGFPEYSGFIHLIKIIFYQITVKMQLKLTNALRHLETIDLNKLFPP